MSDVLRNTPNDGASDENLRSSEAVAGDQGGHHDLQQVGSADRRGEGAQPSTTTETEMQVSAEQERDAEADTTLASVGADKESGRGAASAAETKASSALNQVEAHADVVASANEGTEEVGRNATMLRIDAEGEARGVSAEHRVHDDHNEVVRGAELVPQSGTALLTQAEEVFQVPGSLGPEGARSDADTTQRRPQQPSSRAAAADDDGSSREENRLQVPDIVPNQFGTFFGPLTEPESLGLDSGLMQYETRDDYWAKLLLQSPDKSCVGAKHEVYICVMDILAKRGIILSPDVMNEQEIDTFECGMLHREGSTYEDFINMWPSYKDHVGLKVFLPHLKSITINNRAFQKALTKEQVSIPIDPTDRELQDRNFKVCDEAKYLVKHRSLLVTEEGHEMHDAYAFHSVVGFIITMRFNPSCFKEDGSPKMEFSELEIRCDVLLANFAFLREMVRDNRHTIQHVAPMFLESPLFRSKWYVPLSRSIGSTITRLRGS